MRIATLIFLVLLTGFARAELPGVLAWEAHQDLDVVYKEVYNSLEENRFFVVFVVFCNAWYANQVSNLEPDLLALCPLHVSLYARDGVTRVVFIRPTHAGLGGNAATLLKELEADVSAAIQQGLKMALSKQSDLPPEGKEGDVGNKSQP
jgi:hypothetical protein